MGDDAAPEEEAEAAAGLRMLADAVNTAATVDDGEASTDASESDVLRASMAEDALAADRGRSVPAALQELIAAEGDSARSGKAAGQLISNMKASLLQATKPALQAGKFHLVSC